MNIFLIIGVPLVLHFLLAWRTQRMINRTVMLNSFQKSMNTVLNWVIPFFWGFLVKNLIQPPENPVKTKANRRGRRTKGNENGIGAIEASSVDSSFGGDGGF